MSEGLKKGWRSWRFDQMATIVNDRIDDPSEANVDYYVGLEHLDSESLTIRRWGSPSDVNATKLLFRKGDIIFGRRRVYQRKLAVAHFDGICSAHAMVLRAKSDVVLPEFLPFFMQSDLFMERAKQISVGSLSPTINWKTLAKEEYALPPMEEQEKYLMALSSLVSYKNTLIHTLHNLNLTIERFQTDFVNKNNAEKAFIKDICILKGGSGFPQKYQGSNVGELPFFKVSDMNSIGNNKYMKVAANYISRKDAIDIKASIFPPQSIVFAKVGAALLQNRRRILMNDSCIDNNMMGAIPNLNLVLPEYLWLILIGIDFGQYVQAGAIPSINQAIIGEVKKPLPDIDEQQFIINHVLKLEHHYNLICNKLKKQDHIFSIVMRCLTDV